MARMSLSAFNRGLLRSKIFGSLAYAAKGTPVFGPSVLVRDPIQLLLQIHSDAVSFGFCGQTISRGLLL